MKNIVVFGYKGILGYAMSLYFENRGYNVKKVSREEFDIAKDDHSLLFDIIKEDDVVINCAGVIKPRIKEMSIEDVIRVNAIFPKNLSKVTKQKNVKCFHITTDCVYTGSKGRYNEDDLFDADDLYGLSKSAGDNAGCMVLRTSIIGEENNQSRSLLEWAKSQAGKEVNGFTNHLWNGVTTLYLAEVIETILKNDLYEEGLFHIHSPNTVDKFELLNIFNEAYGLNLTVNKFEAGTAVDRSLASKYELTKKTAVKTIEEQAKEMRKFFEGVKSPSYTTV